MPLTLAASAEISPSGVPRVRLEVDGAVNSQVTVSRQDPSGAWTPVRSADPLNLAGSGTAFDYEAPFDETVLYEVDDAGTTAQSAPVSSVSGGVPWLLHPGRPEESVRLQVVEWPTWKHPIERGVFAPIGRKRRVVVGSVRLSPEGDLVLYTSAHDTTDALEAILADGTPLLLKGTRTENAGTRWVSVGEVTQQPVEIDLRAFTLWTLPLVEVDRPEGVSVAAATYADSTAAFGTYANAKVLAPTYEDRTAGNY